MCACVIVLIFLYWRDGFWRENSCSVTHLVVRVLPNNCLVIRGSGPAFEIKALSVVRPFGRRFGKVIKQLTTYYQTKQPPRCEDSNLDFGASSSCWCCLAPPALAQMISKCLHEQRRYFLVSKSFLFDWWYLPSRFWPLCLRRCVRCPQWCELHEGWRYHMGHSNNQHHLPPHDSLPQLWCQWYCIRQEDQLFQAHVLPPAAPIPPPSCRCSRHPGLHRLCCLRLWQKGDTAWICFKAV